MARAGIIRVDVSDAILDELVTVLRDDFHWEGYRLYFAREQLAKSGNLVAPVRAVRAVKEDPDDDRIIECAAEAGSDFIITADKDLLRLGSYAGIPITQAAEFLQRGIGF